MIISNQNPYFDDYNEEKGFHQILFKPGYAVQARELTQLQSILQTQIERFGKHVFKEGSIVLGGNFNIDNKIDYVKISTAITYNQLIQQYKDTVVSSSSNGVSAYVVDIANKDDWDSSEHILIIRYTRSGDDVTVFQPGESISNSVGILTVGNTSPTGKGSYFTIDEGVVFSRGYFVAFSEQNIIIDPTSTKASCKIGFENYPTIISSVEDETLLDNSQGSYNYSAPGADRVRLTPILKRVSYDEVVSLPDFVTLFNIAEGNVQDVKERSEYARLYDEFAKRTYDESGDYVVRGLGIMVREHLDTGSNEGYLTAVNGGDDTLLAIGVEPGLAYVKGREVNNISTKYIPTTKSVTYENVNSEIISSRSGNYIIVNQLLGNLNQDVGSVVNIYDTAEQRVTSKINVTATPTGSVIGTAKVKFILREDTNTYKVYIISIDMADGYIFSDARAIGTTGFFADILLDAGKAVVKESSTGYSLLFPVGTSYVKTIRGEGDIPDTTFSFRRTYNNNSVASTGIFSISNSITNETHTYGSSGELDNNEKNSIIVSCANDVSINLPGTISGTVGTKNITGVSTYFTRLNIGDKLEITGASGYYIIHSILSNVSLTVVENLSNTVSGASFKKQYLAGDIIDFTVKGSDSGEVRSIIATSDNSLTFDMKEAITGLTVHTSFNIVRNSALEIKKTRKSNRYVKINCSTLSSLTDPINLGFSDLYQIRSIRKKTGSAFTTESEGSDVTALFKVDNGQRDQYYSHASITAVGTGLTSSDHLLVKLDYFAPDYTQGVGYFSVDSYNVDDSSDSDITIFTHQIPVYRSSYDGIDYDLRNYLDFRPVTVNTSNDSTTVAGASTNPSTSSVFNMNANGLRIPLPSSQIICDYSYYLARRDAVVVDQNGSMYVVQGVPAVNPVSPSPSDQVMTLANVFIPPYPSLSISYARILNKQSQSVKINNVYNIRYTMRDIGSLAKRIDNLEYYSALSLLEKNAVDMKIVDENGLDRFKNGLFIDNFKNHLLGNTSNTDYNIAVDSKEGVIRPFFDMDSFMFKYVNGINAQATGNLVSLPYNEKVLIEQPVATTVRNVHQSVYRYIGKIYTNPEADTWIDTKTVDATIDFGGDILPNKTTSTTWGSWETTGTTKRGYGAGYSKPYYVETSAIQQNIGTETTVSYKKEMEKLGEFVTDVQLQTYVNPQTIQIICLGLKPNTRFWIWFDNEDMTSYCTPGKVDNFTLTVGSNIFDGNVVTAVDGSIEGAAVKSNDQGQLFCLLRLPAEGKRFRTGTKEISITDTNNNILEDAVSYATGSWMAGGLAVQKQNTIISTVVPEVTTKQVVDSRKVVLSNVMISSHACTAYSFKVQAPDGEQGVFLTSIDIYVQSNHPTLGAWFEVREMDNAGGITTNQVPFSEVWYKGSDIVTTDDGTIPCNIKFPSPIFLLNDTYYAFIIHTEATHPDMYTWFARLGETDVNTGIQFNDRSMMGDVYVAHNNYNWVPVLDVNLKCRINIADFTSMSGTANFVNGDYEFFTTTEPLNNYNKIGELIVSSDILTLNDVSVSRAVIAGDKIVSGLKEATVVQVVGNKYYTTYTGESFTAGAVSIVNELDVFLGTANLVDTNRGEGYLYKYDSNSNHMVLKNSNGLFFEGGLLVGRQSNIESHLVSFEEYKYSTINLQPNHLELSNTSCSYIITGTLSSTGLSDTPKTINANSTDSFLNEYIIRSMSDEVMNYSGDKSVKMSVSLSSGSSYTSPIIDLRRINSVFIHNLINNDITGEDGVSGGSMINKYISQTVTLAENQDAEDLKVYITAYIPQGSAVKIWAKIRNSEDGTIFNNRPWIELTSDSEGIFSSTANVDDFREFEYNIPDSLLTGSLGEVQYVSSGSTYTGFKQFAIKIGFLGDNSAMVPRVGDLRVIALQK